MTGLIYVGEGAWVAPIPARDLTEAEVAAFGEEALLKTGLYQKPTEKASFEKDIFKKAKTKDGE